MQRLHGVTVYPTPYTHMTYTYTMYLHDVCIRRGVSMQYMHMRDVLFLSGALFFTFSASHFYSPCKSLVDIFMNILVYLSMSIIDKITGDWWNTRPADMHETELGDLWLCETYCSCGSPDPRHLGHSPSCTMTLPVDILLEVEALCQ